ncbi:hypothetical protein E5083_19550 [Streptomyces bauhiniae]|uniref:Uncharacterized protein n=1 Tax=Streptomyces bauhiniae TaxID=2340725 RepID=A0A4Z1D3G6_9ACTN|nr:hypothetical protein E5083_19550 [Streptomyces bauhiniae]
MLLPSARVAAAPALSNSGRAGFNAALYTARARTQAGGAVFVGGALTTTTEVLRRGSGNFCASRVLDSGEYCRHE